MNNNNVLFEWKFGFKKMFYLFIIIMVSLALSEMYKLFAEPFCVMKQMAF
jgi:hypothetical protein